MMSIQPLKVAWESVVGYEGRGCLLPLSFSLVLPRGYLPTAPWGRHQIGDREGPAALEAGWAAP